MSLYGWRTSNFVESVFGSQLVQGMLSLAPLQFFEAICCSMVDAMYQRTQSAAKWVQEAIIITPAARIMYDQQSATIGKYAIQHASTEIAYVWNTAVHPRQRRRVNKVDLNCTCPFMHQFGIPCRHLIAALSSCNMLDGVNNAFNSCYLTSSYDATFRNKAIHVPLESEIDDEEKTIVTGHVFHHP